MTLLVGQDYVRIRYVTIDQTSDYKGIIVCHDEYDLTLRDEEWEMLDGKKPATKEMLSQLRRKAESLTQIRMAGPIVELLMRHEKAEDGSRSRALQELLRQVGS